MGQGLQLSCLALGNTGSEGKPKKKESAALQNQDAYYKASNAYMPREILHPKAHWTLK